MKCDGWTDRQKRTQARTNRCEGWNSAWYRFQIGILLSLMYPMKFMRWERKLETIDMLVFFSIKVSKRESTVASSQFQRKCWYPTWRQARGSMGTGESNIHHKKLANLHHYLKLVKLPSWCNLKVSDLNYHAPAGVSTGFPLASPHKKPLLDPPLKLFSWFF